MFLGQVSLLRDVHHSRYGQIWPENERQDDENSVHRPILFASDRLATSGAPGRLSRDRSISCGVGVESESHLSTTATSMLDLYIGILIMTALSGVVFAFTMLVTRRAPMWVVDGLAALDVIAIAVYARWIWEDTFIGRLLPFSNLIIISNWFPLAAGMLAGLVWRRIGNKPAKFLGLGSLEYGSRPRKLLFEWLMVGALATLAGNIVLVIVHALMERKENWWCGQAPTVCQSISDSVATY